MIVKNIIVLFKPLQ